MPRVEKLPQVSYLSLRVVPHQVHVEVRVGFIWRRNRSRPMRQISLSALLEKSQYCDDARSDHGGSPAEKKKNKIEKQTNALTVLGSAGRHGLHRRPGRLPAPDDADDLHLVRVVFQRRHDVVVGGVVPAAGAVVAAADVEVVPAYDEHVDVVDEVAVEEGGVGAVGEHFFDLGGVWVGR